MIYYLVVAAIILFDQLIKYLVFSNMNVGQSLPVIGDIRIRARPSACGNSNGLY